MNYSDYRFTLDIQIHQAQVSVPVTLGDSARRLCIGLTDGRKSYSIGDGCRAVFNAKKPNGDAIKNDCIIERNVILYEFTTQTTNVEGTVNCEITLYDADGKVLTSPRFIINVDKRVVRDEDIPISESESTTLEGIIRSELARVEAENKRAEAAVEMEEATERANTISQTLEDKLAAGEFHYIITEADKDEIADEIFFREKTIEDELRGFKNDLSEFEANLDSLNNGGLVLEEEFIGSQVNSWLDEHPEATTTVQDDSLTIKKFKSGDLFIAPQMFGAKGDGVTDDTAAIQAAVNALGEYGVLYFPHGVYKVSVPSAWQSAITVYQNQNVLIYGDNAKIKMATNGFRGNNIINIKDSNNITVRGLILEGDRMTHDYITDASSHEWCYGINVTAVAEGTPVNVLIDNCEIFNMAGDGVVTDNGLGSGVIRITNCNIHHCRRQGVSVLDSDIVQIENTEIHHIGDHDGITGTAPKCGIDFEPTSGSLTVNKVVIKNTKFYECSNMAIVSGQPQFAKEIIIEGCEFLNVVSITPPVWFKNCTFGSRGDVNTYVNLQSKDAYYEDCLIMCGGMLLGRECVRCCIYAESLDKAVRIQYVPLNNCYVENAHIRHDETDHFKGAKMTTFHNVSFKNNWTAENAESFDMCMFDGEIRQLGRDHSATTFVFNNCYAEKKPVFFGVYNGGYVGT